MVSRRQLIRNPRFHLLAAAVVLLSAAGAAAQPQPAWNRSFGGPWEDYGKALITTSDNGLAITGMTKSYGDTDGDMFLLKTSYSGFYQWGKKFGGGALDKGKEIVQTDDNGYVIAGYSFTYGAGDRDGFVIKTDELGNQLWAHAYGGPGRDSAFDLVRLAGGGFFVTGDYQLPGGTRNSLLIRLDEAGGTIWEQTLGGESLDTRTFSGCQLDNGNLVYTGWRRHNAVDYPDFHLACIDTGGALLWEREFGGPGIDIARRVRPVPGGGFVMIGETDVETPDIPLNTDLFLGRYDDNGDTLWTRTFGTSGDEDCYALQITSGSDIVEAGSTKGEFGPGWDLYVSKFDLDGNQLWMWTHATMGLEFGRGLIEQAPGQYVVTGKTTTGTDSYGSAFLLKLVETGAVLPNGMQEVTMTPLLASESETPSTPVSGYRLLPILPNPSNAGAVITIALPEAARVSAVVYNSLGREVATLVNGPLDTGNHSFALQGSNLASGVYFVHAVVPGQLDQVQKLTLVR